MKNERVTVLTETDTIVSHILAEMRNKDTHNNRLQFRNWIETIGMIEGYELSRRLKYTDRNISTPLADTTVRELDDFPVIATVLRAGIPLQHGVGKIFTESDLAYISAYRRNEDDGDPEIVVEYIACPDLDGRVLVLTDPMVATGKSLTSVYQAFSAYGTPSKVYVLAVIGSKEGVQHVLDEIPSAEIIIGAVDPELNDHAYIVPGLGDAGDLSFGVKKKRK